MKTKEHVAKFRLVIINYSDSDLDGKLTCLSFEIVYSTENGKVVRLKPPAEGMSFICIKGWTQFYLALFQGVLSCKWDSVHFVDG
jgi:hypothetical protein